VSSLDISTLTTIEERLWHAFPTGALVDLRSGPDDGPDQAESWPRTRDIRAEVITALLTGSGPHANGGAGVKLAGVRVIGRLALAHMTVPYALDFERCCFDDGLDLAEAETRSVRLRGCYLTVLEANRAEIRGELQMEGCRLDRLSLYAARVFEIEISGTTITAPPPEPKDPHVDWTPPRTAVNGDLLVVDTAMYCHDVVVDGQFRLPGARIGGYLHLDGARITHEEPNRPPTPALLAQGLRVDTGIYARRGNTRAKNRFTVTGGVDLSGATIKGGLMLPDADLVDDRGATALRADHISVEGGVNLSGLTASGVVRLDSARVVGPLTLSGAQLGTLDVSGARVEGAMVCNAGFTAHSLDLRRARTATFEDDAASWPAQLRLDGFVYDELMPLPTAGTRLKWLARDAYQPQPYEQLAARYRAVGRDGESRRVLLAQQRQRREAAGVPAKVWGLLQDATVGYGYRPWLAGLWLLGLLAAGSVYFASHRPAPMSAGGPHFNAVAYTLDLLVPVVSLGQSGAWNPSGSGQVLAYVLIISGWTLATTLFAGVTRILVRP
jgi:cytoskeletal protein CcmA (bactofilin family)